MSTINGTPGNDVLSTSTSGDFIDAGAGNDQVTLALGSVADGGAGDDLLTIDLHADSRDQSFQLTDGGGYGDSYFSGWGLVGWNFESFHITTGAGNDTGRFYPAYATSVWGPDVWDAGAGTDTLVVDMTNDTTNITAGYINATTYQVTQNNPSSPVLMTAYNVESVVIVARNAANGNTTTLTGGAGDDQLISYAPTSILNGGDGNDFLVAYSSGTLDGGNGFDTVSTGTLPFYWSPLGYTVTFNGDGTITLTDTYATRLLKNIERVSYGSDSMLLGSLGNDVLTLPHGNGFFGGPGDDTITVAFGSGDHLIDGGAGNDTVLFSLSFASYAIGTNSKGDITVTGKFEYPPYQTTLVNIETAKFNGVAAQFGTGGDDVLTGTGSDDILVGGGGNDTLNGGGGNDAAVFSNTYDTSVITFNLNGSVTVTGPDGADTLSNIESASFSDATVTLGTIGNDSVVLNGPTDGSLGPGFAGGAGNDTVTANNGAIFFDGGAGTDTIILPFNYFSYTISSGYPYQPYATQINLARLLNVEIVQFNNATATLSNGQLTFIAAQPVLNNSYGSVNILDTDLPTILDPNITLTNIGGSPMTGAVIKIASGFVAGDILSANLTGTSINASYNAATGTLTLSGADTAAHYQQVLRSVQLTANATYNDHPSAGSVTWQVTNSDAQANVSALVTTTLNLPYPKINFAQMDETVFISGVNPNGTVAPKTYATWTDDGGLPSYDPQHSDAPKWGSSTPGTAGGTVSYYFDAASGWTAAEKTMISGGLALWSAVANINFSVTANPAGAGITFIRGHDGDAYTSHSLATGSITVGQINGTDMSQFASAVISIDTSTPGFGPIGDFTAYGGYTVMTVLHEEGHALGLGHGGPYNAGGANSNYNFFQEGIYDSQLWSLMSYIDPQDSRARWFGSYDIKGTEWLINSPTTPMVLDIAAAQLLYGTPVSSPLSGGQVYGFNTNITGAIRPFFDFTQNTNPVVTLWNMGANNTLDLSGFSTNSTVNLNPGTFSSADGMINNISIALNTKIDKFVGGAGNDVIMANNNGDTLFGGGGNDLFKGGTGNDTFDGGSGSDLAVYTSAYANYTITHNLNGSYTVSGPGGTDSLTHIEKAAFSDQTIAIGTVAPSDFDGSNTSDVLLQDASGQAMIWLLNGSTVTSSALVSSNPGPTWHVKGSSDFDGDGKADILWQNDSGQAALWLMSGTNATSQAWAGGNPGPTWHVKSAGDFDGDRRADILWQNDDGTAAIWLMNGATPVGAGLAGANAGPSWQINGSGDFDGDGKADILWQNDSGQAAIWLMNGTSVTNQAWAGSNPGTSWHVKGAGDFDGNGKADILWQNDSGQAMIWLMNGTSVSSQASVGPNLGASWNATSAADIDGDGRADILWQNSNGQTQAWIMNGTSVSSQVSIGSNPGASWLAANNGFTPPPPPPPPKQVPSDFDGDGKADLLWQDDSGQAMLWQLNGTSIAASALAGANPGPTWHIKGSGDFDGDGKADILWQNDNGYAALWFMDGASPVSAALAGGNPGPTWHVKASGDFNGDHKADILWQNDNGYAAIWLMNGATPVGAALAGANTGPTWQIKGSGDFNGDGKADILWQNDSGQAAIWLMNGTDATSQAWAGTNPGASWHVKGAGDFDGDGKADILWQNDSGQAMIWLMNGTTVSSQASVGPNLGAGWKAISAADIDGDGKADILWQNDSGQAQAWIMDGTSVSSQASIGGNPGASWHVANAGFTPPPVRKVASDFDANGKSDLLMQDSSGQAVIWMLNGSNVTTNAPVGGNPGPSWHVKGSGDFDGDGKADILWQNDSGQAALWQMDGTSVLSQAWAGGNPGPSWHVKNTGDFDGDGKADILWQNDSGQAALWFMNGATVIGGALAGGDPGPSWHVKSAGDFDGDGKADLLWQNDSGQAALWFMDGANVTGQAWAGTNPGASWHVKGSGDFDGNGKADILWQNDSGQAMIWLMNGASVSSSASVGANLGPTWNAVSIADTNGDGKSDILWQKNDGNAALWQMSGTSVVSTAPLGLNPGPTLHLIAAAY